MHRGASEWVTDGDYDEAGIILFKWGVLLLLLWLQRFSRKGFEGFFTLTTTTRMAGNT